MAQFNAFAPFGLFRFSSAPTPAETAYKALVAGYGTKAFSLAQNGSNEIEAKIYATAIQAGVARACGIEKAWNQQLPLSASDKLPSLEADWGVTVNANDSLQTQQAKVAAQFLLQRGARQEAIESALTALLGAGFYTLRVTQPSERLSVPAPPNDSSAGAWQPVDQAPKYVRLLAPVINRSTAPPRVFSTIPFALVGGSAQLQPGDVLTVEPNHNGRAEAVQVTALTGIGPGTPAGVLPALTAWFTQPHDVGVYALTCCPWWKSNQRHVRVIVSRAVAANQEQRRQINELMAKHMKSTTTWDICAVNAANATQTGAFTIGKSLIGADALGDAPFTY